MAASTSGPTCLPEETAASQVSGTDAPAKKQKPKATSRMMWDNQKDLILIGEVILARPFQFRQGTRERGKAWQEVADAMRARDYKVDKRAVRDRVTHLMDKLKDQNRKEKAASGIAVEETEEERKIRESVEDLIQEEEDIESAPREKGDEEKKKMDAAEMRKRACETYGETQKRHHGESSNTPRRSRTTGSETLGLIQKKLEMDQALRKEELARKREDEERRRQEERERDRRYELLQQQQQEQQQQFQQQQQQMQQQFQQQQQQFQQQQQQLQQQLLQQQQLMQQQVQQNQTFMMAFLKAQEKRD